MNIRASISFLFPPLGEYTYSGRDSLIFLVDASRAMFKSEGEHEMTPFDMSIQVRLPFYLKQTKPQRINTTFNNMGSV